MKEGSMTGQKKSKRFVSMVEGKKLDLQRGGGVRCCEQWRYMYWRAPEKMTQCWWTGDPQEKPRCSRKDNSKKDSSK